MKYNGKKTLLIKNHKNIKHLAITYKEVCRLSARTPFYPADDRHKAPGGDSSPSISSTYMLSAVSNKHQIGVSPPEKSLTFSWKSNQVTILKNLGWGRRKN